MDIENDKCLEQMYRYCK